jgi:hypothetical protein
LLHFVISVFLFSFVAPSFFCYIFLYVIHSFLLAFFNSLLISYRPYIFLSSKPPLLNAFCYCFLNFFSTERIYNENTCCIKS